jgi:hypothetical protein
VLPHGGGWGGRTCSEAEVWGAIYGGAGLGGPPHWLLFAGGGHRSGVGRPGGR